MNTFRLLSLLLAMALLPLQAGAGTTVPPNPAETFLSECSDCHMAYQAGFLPKRSWSAILATLPDHFGEDASLDAASRKDIEAYLRANAADRDGRNPRWLRAIPADAVPLRISELPWFRREHGARRVARAKSDPEIGSISNCQACHRGAERGFYDDD